MKGVSICIYHLSTVTERGYTVFIATNLFLIFKKRQYNPFCYFPSSPHFRSTVVPMEQVQHLQTILQQVPLLCQLSQIQWTIPPLTDMEILFTQPQVFFSFSQFRSCIFAVKRLWHGNGYYSPPRFLNHLRWLDLQPSMRRNQSKLHIKPAWFHSILKLVPLWPREALSILTFKADQCEKTSFSKEVKLWALSPNELESEKQDGSKKRQYWQTQFKAEKKYSIL